MKRTRRAGITRRPVEYLLIFTAVLLVVILLWSLQVIRRDTNRLPAGRPLTAEDLPRYDDIQFIAEKNFAAENMLDSQYETWLGSRSTAQDGAADNVSGIYDETTY